MENFFERVGPFWPAGRRDLHWHILPTSDEASALAGPYKGLAVPGLQSVPTRWSHCTLLHAVGLGAADVHTDGLIKAVASYAQTRSPFPLTFDRPAVGNLAVEISGWPGRPFTEIVEAVTQATVRTGAAFKAAPSRYPHISVAYAAEGAEDVDAVVPLGASVLGAPWLVVALTSLSAGAHERALAWAALLTLGASFLLFAYILAVRGLVDRRVCGVASCLRVFAVCLVL